MPTDGIRFTEWGQAIKSTKWKLNALNRTSIEFPPSFVLKVKRIDRQNRWEEEKKSQQPWPVRARVREHEEDDQLVLARWAKGCGPRRKYMEGPEKKKEDEWAGPTRCEREEGGGLDSTHTYIFFLLLNFLFELVDTEK